MRVGSRNPAWQHDGLIMLIFILVEEVQILYINDLLEFSTATIATGRFVAKVVRWLYSARLN